MKRNYSLEEDNYKRAKKKVNRIKGFYSHLVVYVCVNTVITSVYVVNNIWDGASFINAFWDLQTFFTWVPWGIGLLIHGICALDFVSIFMDKNWEHRKMKKLLEKEYKNSTMNWE